MKINHEKLYIKKKTNYKYHNIQRNKYSLSINYWRQFCFIFYVNIFLDAALCLVTHCVWLCDPMDCSPLGSSVRGDSPGKNTRMDCHALLQRIFPTQGSNPGLPHCRWILLLTEPPGKSFFLIFGAILWLPLHMTTSYITFRNHSIIIQSFLR